jgi:predicted phosphodiesterase
MVNKKTAPPVLGSIVLIFLLGSCPFSYYDDFDSRFSYHDVFHFLTPADRNLTLGDNYSFIVLSDIHISSDSDAADFAKVKDHLNGAQFVVVTGDITQEGTREELQKFIDTAGTFGVPCYPVIGNHDIYDNRGAPWKELIGSSVYRIDSDTTTLFMLDNANGYFEYDQFEWFAGEMKNTKKNVFVFAHDNFFMESSPPDAEQTTDIRERARMMSLLKNRCHAMFMGHLHKRIIKNYGGVEYIILENYGASNATGTICRVHVSNGGFSYEFEKL